MISFFPVTHPIAELQTICSAYWQRIYGLEGDKFDLEHIQKVKEYEVKDQSTRRILRGIRPNNQRFLVFPIFFLTFSVVIYLQRVNQTLVNRCCIYAQAFLSTHTTILSYNLSSKITAMTLFQYYYN